MPEHEPKNTEWPHTLAEATAKIVEQRTYIDVLVKAGQHSQEEADCLKALILTEVARNDAEYTLHYRLEAAIADLNLGPPTGSMVPLQTIRERLLSDEAIEAVRMELPAEGLPRMFNRRPSDAELAAGVAAEKAEVHAILAAVFDASFPDTKDT